MRVIQNDLWLCEECTIAAVNGDLSDVNLDDRVKSIENGLDELGPNLVPDFDEDNGILNFSSLHCDCCGTGLSGSRHRFAILGEDEDEDEEYAEPILTAVETDGTWAVDDEAGGRWFPGDDAEAEILASEDPAATAVRICRELPMRGTWHN